MVLIIDNRMRDIEKEKLKSLGYDLIEIPKSHNVYEEISSHVDIFCLKVNNKLICEESIYNIVKSKTKEEIIIGDLRISDSYPENIKYNVCIVGNKAIHNFKYTDTKIKQILAEQKFHLIDIKQGYSKCSIAVIDNNSIITSDYGIYKKLSKYDLDILFLDYTPNIKLINENCYSKKNGFIGGVISKIGNNIIVTGDLEKIDKNNNIKNFIESKGLNIIDFKNLDVIDYGGIVICDN